MLGEEKIRWMNKNSFICSSINDIYKKILFTCFSEGRDVGVRGYETKDLSFTQFIFRNPELNILLDRKRKLNYAFMFRELWWYLTGDNRVQPLAKFNKNIQQFSDDGKTLFGAYGPYIEGQMWTTLEKIKQDIHTRQATIPINSKVHNIRGFSEKSKDIPCTMFLHFMCYDGKHLSLITHMRSQDLWWGFPYDVASFSMILCMAAKYLGLEIGWLIHNVDSTHIYMERIEEIGRYINSSENNVLKTYHEHINYNINESWLDGKKFWGTNSLIYVVDKIANGGMEEEKYENTLDDLFRMLQTEPLLLVEHVCVMICYLMQKERIPMYNYDKWNKVLINIGSPFKWIF